MSAVGDVVWADGVTWVRQTSFKRGYVRGPWRSFSDTGVRSATKRDLRVFDDYRRIVKNGHLVI